MSLTLLAPVSLAEGAVQLARRSVRLPGLETLCARAAIEVSDRSLDAITASLLGIRASPAAPPPIAPLRLAAEDPMLSESARDGCWLCADPVTTALMTDDARIDAPVVDLTRDEADALIAALSAHFAVDRLRFAAPAPGRWYVRINSLPGLSTTPLWQAIGRSMLAALPAGDDGPMWRARLNEAQMLLHAHPVNAAREARGAVRVGSPWFWGGGTWPEFEAAQVDRVVGGPRWVGAAARSNGVAGDAPAGDLAALARDPRQRTLVFVSDDWEAAAIDVADSLARWDRLWFTPLARALDAHGLDTTTLLFASGTGSLSIRPTAGRSPALDWRRWFGQAKPAPTLEEALRTLERQ